MPPTTDEVTEQVAEPTPGPETPGTEPTPDEGAGQQQPEAPAADEPEAPGAKQPGDVAPNTTVEVHAGSYGMLTIDPKQKRLTDDQRGALLAIGIDTNKDPAIRDHVAPFIHVCQLRGLDPWAREAYLIGRGYGNNRKYTMQVGIDGYLKMASATGRFVRVAEILWTGADDDDRSWREVEKDGRIVRRRVWSDAWPAVRGNPGQALAVIEHYDEFGNVTTTEAIADWTMYAPYNEKKTGTYPNKVTVTDDAGKPVMELSEMWSRGGAHMLAKCATALACRRAFPGATAGTYMTEEMHAADAAEIRRQEQQARNDRSRKVQSLRPANQGAEPPAVDPATGEADPTDARDPGPVDPVEAMKATPSGPLPGVVDAEIVDEASDVPPEPAEGQEREWLLAELDLMGRVLHNPPAALMRRAVATYRKNLEDFTDAELLASIAPLRPMVTQQLRSALPGQAGLADAWAQVTPDQCGPTWWLLGLREGDQPFTGDAPIG